MDEKLLQVYSAVCNEKKSIADVMKHENSPRTPVYQFSLDLETILF